MGSVELSGAIAATVLPLEEDGHTVDEASFRSLVRRLAGVDGIEGVVVNAVAGEGSLLEPDERTRLVRAACEEVGPEVSVISSVRADAVSAARSAVEDAGEAGARAVLVQAPPVFARGAGRVPEVAIRYFEEITRPEVPLVVFQHQVGSGRSYPTPLLLDLLALDGVVGVKETTWDVGAYERDVRAIRDADLDVAVLCANDTLLLPCLVAARADGLLLGLASLVPERVARLWESVERDDLVEARQTYDELWPIVSSIYADPPLMYYARAKAAMQMMGLLRTDLLRAPLVTISDDEREELREVLGRSGMLESGLAR